MNRDADDQPQRTMMAQSVINEDAEKIEQLRQAAHATRREAEKAWYALFCALPVGEERIYASNVCERIRCATRILE